MHTEVSGHSFRFRPCHREHVGQATGKLLDPRVLAKSQREGWPAGGCRSPAVAWASYLMAFFLQAMGVCSALWESLGSRGTWVDPVPGTVPPLGSGLRAIPESEEGSLTGHQPASPLVLRGSPFSMCTTMSSVVLIINLLFLCLS